MIKNNDYDLALVMCPSWGIDHPPAGISYLKGYLKNLGFDVKCFDFSLKFYKDFSSKEYWNLNYPEYFTEPEAFGKNVLPSLGQFIDRWAEEILSNNPRVVGFSLFMSSVMVSLLLAKQLKKARPGIIIVGGGPEITRLKRVMVDGIRRFAFLEGEVVRGGDFDILIDGEGEEALAEILQLVRQGKDFRGIKGGLYTEEGRIIANEARKLLGDLDILPPPDYSDFSLDDYARRSLPVVTSRGCVNRCTFCADSPLWKTYRARSPEKVVEEIRSIAQDYKRDEFEIIDSTFNGDIRRVEKICNLITRYKLPIHWSAKVTLNSGMTQELLCKMKEAGCSSLAYGLESGSPNVLKDMRKNYNLPEVKRIIRDTWKSGIQANCFFIIGYPSETEEDFQLTLDFIRENAKFIYCFDQITGCHIEEDSYLGLNADKYGMVFKEDGWYSQHSSPEIRKERLTRFKELAGELHKHYQCEVQQ